jgi:hypothetical protein
MLYVGLDVHSQQSSLCILNSAGGTVNEIQVKGPRSGAVDRLRTLDRPFSICYEASCGYGQLYEQLRPLAHHVAVAHPGKLRLIYGSKRKNDRVDAWPGSRRWSFIRSRSCGWNWRSTSSSH